MRIHSLDEFDNLNALPVLLAVAETGSLTAAARHLDVSAATVSATIKRAETRLGVRLFERTTRALRITAEGTVMIEHARRALAIVAQAQDELRSGARGISGRITITASAMMARELLVDWTADFVARHPAVEIDLQGDDQQADLVRGGFDVALRNGPLPDSGLAARLLTPARRWACASPAYLRKHPAIRQPQDLAQHACLVTRRGGRAYDHWRFAPVAAPQQCVDVKVGGRLWSHDASTAFLWALGGRGVTYQSEVVVADAIRRGDLARVLPKYVGDEVPLYAVLPANRLVPGRVNVLLNELSAFFAARQKAPARA